jgi:hypothetical protein
MLNLRRRHSHEVLALDAKAQQMLVSDLVAGNPSWRVFEFSSRNCLSLRNLLSSSPAYFFFQT